MYVSREFRIVDHDAGGLIYPQEPVEVEWLRIEEEAGEGLPAIPTQTELFRPENVLPVAITEMYKRTSENQELTVVSAACSVGAEADTVIATHNKNHRRAGKLAVLGYDINPIAVERAKTATYAAIREGDPKKDSRLQARLKDFGFKTGSRLPLKGRYGVESDAVREGHDVSFEKFDLTDSAPFDGKADLVLANNVLYHLSPEQADRFLYNAAVMLQESGVISLGNSSWAYDRRMQSIRSENDKGYWLWLREAEKMLKKTFGLKPIVRGHRNIAMMFSRDTSVTSTN
ncbi:MAG: CheR family methyltransferase [Patescibacteria group bacterium]